jgi:TetR/AcrR family transcriptional regulator
MPARATSPVPESRTAILDAAEDRFARQGFDATTIKQIAGDAGVNSALLYYYFADKEALYGAVVSRFIERIAAAVAPTFGGDDTPADRLRAFARRQARTFESEPRFRKLLGRELIDFDARHAQAAFRHLAATTFARLHASIVEGQRAGIFRDDLDPRFVAISLVGQTAYFHFARPAVEILLADGKPLSAGTSDAFAEHVAEFTLAALAPVRAPVVAPPIRNATSPKTRARPKGRRKHDT